MIARLLNHKLGLAGLLLTGVAVALWLAYNARPPGLIACACSDLAPPPSTNWLAAQAAATYYVDGTNGDDNNPGTAVEPWQTVQHASDTIAPGDTVIIAAGIYRGDDIRFGPPGEGPNALTTFKAAPGARVIFTTADDRPPTVYITRSYLRIEGLWFGGQFEEETRIFTGGGFDNRFGKELIDNTFFGYEELSAGAIENVFFQGNRFVNFGGGTGHHTVYLSGGYGPYAQHAIVDNNIFVSGFGGYAIHGWHNWRSSIITRNFIGEAVWGLVTDGSDHLIANNFIWRSRGLPGNHGPIGAWLPGKNVIFVNNILGPSSPIIGSHSSNLLSHNAFLETAAAGNAAITLTPGEEATELGVSAANIDAAISALNNAFAQPVNSIYTDAAIETHFATLRPQIPQESPLYEAGVDWNPFDGLGTMNVGPDVLVPASPIAFWLAFIGQGLCDWDSFGNVDCAELHILFIPLIITQH